jgi:Asp-tRNA(Asn)/Glu-tRNA(Gln) amidotransferase C subunit
MLRRLSTRATFRLPEATWRLATAMRADAGSGVSAPSVSDETIREVAKLAAIDLREGTEEFARAKRDFASVLQCLETVHAFRAAHPTTAEPSSEPPSYMGTPDTGRSIADANAAEAEAEEYLASLRDDVPTGLGLDASSSAPALGSSRLADADTAALAGAVPRSTLLAASSHRKGSFYAVRQSRTDAEEDE